jgi:hypothetical protein
MFQKHNRRAFGMGIAMLEIISCALMSVSYAKSTSKIEKLTGHVLGCVPNILKWNGDGGDLLPFVFIPDATNKEAPPKTAVVVDYRWFSDERELPNSFFNYSKHFEITVLRNSGCDTTAADFFYLKLFHDDILKKPAERIYRFQIAANAPKMDFADDFKLPCYEMRPGNYSLLK